ncbi:MAG: hypothetical protein LUC35_06750, partial [Clostridiales bacterium]|nr:hypothetical protein [Clostridiales bacterium]
METSVARVTILLVFFLVLPIGAIVLQIFLSRMESRVPGLILPGLNLVVSVLTVLLMVAYVGSLAEVIATILSTLLLFNIPTVILLLIYYVCRRKYRRQNQMD